MKIKIRKLIIKLSILMIIIGYVLYYFGYIPIVGNLIANKKLSQYYTETKNKPYDIKAEYDWYNTQYKALNRDLTYSLQSDTIHDGYINKELEEEANSQYRKIKKEFKENLTLPSGVHVFTSIDGKDYSIKYQSLYLMSIYNTEDLSEEESLNMPATIADKFISLMGEDYNFTGIQMVYFDKNGGYTIELLNNNYKKLEYKDMLKKTKKLKEEELPQDYLQWLAKQ